MNIAQHIHEPVAAQARRLLVSYVYAIDDGPLSDWPTFFCDPGLYRITTRENEARNMPLSIMLCDNHKMLYDRVEAIEKANIFEPHVYRHVLSDSRVITEAEHSARIETSFICIRTMLDGSMTLFAAGKYIDDVVIDAGQALYRAKTVVIDASKIDTLLALPL
jgi:anthranilate 1,2-dioxygenase small subunit